MDLMATEKTQRAQRVEKICQNRMEKAKRRIVRKLEREDATIGLTQQQMEKKLIRDKNLDAKARYQLNTRITILSLDSFLSRNSSVLTSTDADNSEARMRYDYRLVRRDMLTTHLVKGGPEFRSRVLTVLPDCLRLNSEVGQFVSEEGVLLFLRHMRVPVDVWTSLAALSAELARLKKSVRQNAATDADDERLLQLGWFHTQRRALLKKVCCTSEQHQRHAINYIGAKLGHYERVQKAVAANRHSRNISSFLADAVPSLSNNLQILRRSEMLKNGNWTIRIKEISR